MYSIFEELLQKHKVSTYKVSKETGIAQSVFSSWKNGISTPKQDAENCGLFQCIT